ncbi:hypothetical protein EX30DRAFT_11552 [Ascodesmis nigricans]|uniref:Reverse transcriptase domain-containing protein n=1 Tax=Ascodesmis nigricans TaxID=341454 RepID=A0A4S2N6H7_9PEZI|nr:hypothetical protein EX30DRAFT_11552 [Ascodesmis nigricans]
MASSTSVSSFAGALESLTRVKIGELARRRTIHDRESAALLATLSNLPTYREKLETLLSTLKDKKLRESIRPSSGLHLMQFLVAQGPWDTSLSDEFFKEKFDEIFKGVEQGGNRARFAQLFGAVIQEWMDMEGADEKEAVPGCNTDERPEKANQREILEGYMWENKGVQSDINGFRDLLSEVFGQPTQDDANVAIAEAEKDDVEMVDSSEDQFDDIIAGFERHAKKKLRSNEGQAKLAAKKKMADFIAKVREDMEKFSESFFDTYITAEHVEQAIDACLSYDSLTMEQQRAAREIQQSEKIMGEIASVMMLTLRDLKSWEWPEQGVQLYMRRHLNGKYRCFFEQDMITLIFLQFVGLRFGNQLKLNLRKVVDNGWDWGASDYLSKAELLRRKKMLLEKPTASTQSNVAVDSILGKRIKDLQENYICSALPDFNHITAYGDTSKEGLLPRVMQLKQGVLRRLLTDIQYIHATEPEATVTVATADALNFAPSLPHDIALEAMRFFGVTGVWLDFFSKVIGPPAKFADQTVLRHIQRGTPTSQALGYTMGEAAFMALDVAVNQRVSGLKWYRQHDDIWFWHQDQAKVDTAWKIMQQFANTCGFSWNETKSGSCKILSKKTLDESLDSVSGQKIPGSSQLPQGHVKWGLLELDSTGRFAIDKKLVEMHTLELKERFKKPHSTLQFIRAYSRYMNFFTRNCAQTAVVFSKSHVENLLKTLKTIHDTLFPDHSSSFLKLISSTLHTRFPHIIPSNTPIPEGWLTLPLVFGGLGIPTPMLETYAYLHNFRNNDASEYALYHPSYVKNQGSFTRCLKNELQLYQKSREAWETMSTYPADASIFPRNPVSQRPYFMSFEEFIRARETQTIYWAKTYDHLLSAAKPAPAEPTDTKTINEWLRMFPDVEGYSCVTTLGGRGSLGELEFPWNWWVVTYAPQLDRVFGSMTVLDSWMTLGGMVEKIQERAVKFDL